MGKDNQKKIKYLVKEKHDKDHIFACINKQAGNMAMRDLGASAFSMWYYFASMNENLKNWDLSFVDVSNNLGLSRSVYDRAVHLLIEKGYLVPQINKENEVANEWVFYEVPPDVKKRGGFNENHERSNENQKRSSSIQERGMAQSQKTFQENVKGSNEKQKTNNTNNTEYKNISAPLSSNDAAQVYLRYNPIKKKNEHKPINFDMILNEKETEELFL